MKIAKVRISQILGIEELEFDAGRFVEVMGPNGAGKTSVLEALKSVVKGGEDATLLRKGAEKGEVILLLDDGTEIRKRVTAKNQVTTVEKDGVRVQKPMDTIKALTDMLSVNPVDFLRLGTSAAGKKQRVNVLLESLPIALDADRIEKIVGSRMDLPDLPSAFDQINAIRQAVFDDRTSTNRVVKEKESTINQLAATLPPSSDDGSDDSSGLLDEVNTLDASRDAERERIKTKLDGFRQTNSTKIETIKAESAVKVAELRKQIEAEESAARDLVQAEKDAFADIERLATAQWEKKSAEHAAARAAITNRIAAIEERQRQAAANEQTRKTIATMREQVRTLETDVEKQTAAIAGLDSYKEELLAALPIRGLEVREGEIYRDNIVFDRLNTAQQVDIAVEIGKLRAGELGVICVDGIELLDEAHFAEFRAKAVASGLQMFVTRVSDGPFEIKSGD